MGGGQTEGILFITFAPEINFITTKVYYFLAAMKSK